MPAAPNKGGPKPPSIVSPPPAPVEPVSPVVAAEPAPPPVESAKGDVEAGGATYVSVTGSDVIRVGAPAPVVGVVDLRPVAEALAKVAAAPRPAGTHMAKVRVFVGGQRGHIEPGEVFTPTPADAALFESQGTAKRL